MKKNSSQLKSNGAKKMQKNIGKKAKAKSGDVTTLILRDHKPIKELISILKDPDVKIAKKRPAFADFERQLLSHAKAEQESLYVHLKQVDDLVIQGLEGDTEHAIAEQLIEEINQNEGDNDIWMAKVKVLAELVEHHVKEEEKEVLKEARKEFSAEKLFEIGEMYSELLNKYREESHGPTKYTNKEEMRAEYV